MGLQGRARDGGGCRTVTKRERPMSTHAFSKAICYKDLLILLRLRTVAVQGRARGRRGEQEGGLQASPAGSVGSWGGLRPSSKWWAAAPTPSQTTSSPSCPLGACQTTSASLTSRRGRSPAYASTSHAAALKLLLRTSSMCSCISGLTY